MLNRDSGLLPRISTLLKTALPLMAFNFIQIIYNLTDSYFLGKLGRNFVSAPLLAFSITFVLFSFGLSFSIGGTTIISQAKGSGDLEKMNHYLGQVAFLLAILALSLMVIGYLTIEKLIVLLRTPVELRKYVFHYLITFITGLPFLFTILLLNTGMQGRGDTVTPLIIQLITAGLNVILDPFFIFGIGIFPRLEVLGASLATLIARVVGASIALYLLIKGKDGYRLMLKNIFPRAKALYELVKVSLPIALGYSTASLGFTILQGVVNNFGVAVIAAYGIGDRLTSFFTLPAMGIGSAVSILVGQRLGAKEPEEAKGIVRAGLVTILSFIIPSMCFIYLFGGYLIGLFVDDSEAIMWGSRMLKIEVFSVTLFSLILVYQGAFTGAGDTRPIMFFNIFRLWGLRLPLAYSMAILLRLGPDGLWTAVLISNLIVATMHWFWYKRDRWSLALDVDSL